MFELHPSVATREVPVDADVRKIPALLPCCDFPAERGNVWDATVHALNREGLQLDLGDVQPAAVLGRVLTGLKVFLGIPLREEGAGEKHYLALEEIDPYRDF